jgi:hypothetical protein
MSGQPEARCRVIAVHRRGRVHWLAIVDRCPLCRKKHTHGAGPDGTTLGLRRRHCRDGYDARGRRRWTRLQAPDYVLVAA